MKVKVSEVKDIALDWLVAKCEGGFDLHQRVDWHNKPWAFYFRDDEDPERVDKFYLNEYEPSTDWAQGGPIIEREKIKISPNLGDSWSAQIHHKKGALVGWTSSTGPTPLIAAMRCYVVSEMGEEVEIPEELL